MEHDEKLKNCDRGRKTPDLKAGLACKNHRRHADRPERGRRGVGDKAAQDRLHRVELHACENRAGDRDRRSETCHPLHEHAEPERDEERKETTVGRKPGKRALDIRYCVRFIRHRIREQRSDDDESYRVKSRRDAVGRRAGYLAEGKSEHEKRLCRADGQRRKRRAPRRKPQLGEGENQHRDRQDRKSKRHLPSTLLPSATIAAQVSGSKTTPGDRTLGEAR